MTPTQVLALINQYIVANGVGAITGPILNTILTAIVNLFASSTAFPARVVNVSALAIVLTDYAIGMQRTTGLSAFSTTLPSGASIGQEFVVQDLTGNCNAYPITFVAPVGNTIAGLAQYVMDEDRQTVRFRYYGVNVWGVEAS